MYTIKPSLLIRAVFKTPTPTFADSSTRSVTLELTRPKEEIDDAAFMKRLTIDRIFAVNRPKLAIALEPAVLWIAEINLNVALACRERCTLQLSIAPDGDGAPLEAFGCPLGRQALCAAINAARYDNAVAVARTAHIIPSPLRTIQAVRRAARTVAAGSHGDNASISLAIEWHSEVNGAILVGQHHCMVGRRPFA
jgi:hypothetical protein